MEQNEPDLSKKEEKIEVDKLLPKPVDDVQNPRIKTVREQVTCYLWTAYVDPFKNIYYVWVIISSLAYIYNLIFLIARASFWQLQDIENATVIWFMLDYVLSDFIYLIDIGFKFFVGFILNGELCTDKNLIIKKYLQSSCFWIDILSVIPFEFAFMILVGRNSSISFIAPIFRCNRLLKNYRFSEFRNITETKTKYPTVFRMSNLLINILLLMHWNACIYFIISHVVGFGHDEWVYPSITDPKLFVNYTSEQLNNILMTNQLDVQYIYCFWWSVLTLTTIGEVKQPTEYYQEMYMSILLMIGVIILAITIGSAADMVENANSRSIELQMKCDYAKTYMNQNKITGELESRVKQYLNYLWLSTDLSNGDVLDCLPDNLKKEIAMNVHIETLKQVLIFQDCEPGLLEELVTKLKLQIYSPGDFICRKGDVGHEMYFIKMGTLQVVSPDCTQVYANLKAGAAFGEISILDIPGNKNGNKRTANIRSLGFSHVFELSKSDLWAAINEYPLAKKILLEKGKALLKKDNLLDEELAELTELSQRPMHEKIKSFQEKFNLNSMNEQLDKLHQTYKNILKDQLKVLNLIEK